MQSSEAHTAPISQINQSNGLSSQLPLQAEHSHSYISPVKFFFSFVFVLNKNAYENFSYCSKFSPCH